MKLLLYLLTFLITPKPVFAHNGIPDEPLGQVIFYGLPILMIIIMAIIALKSKKD